MLGNDGIGFGINLRLQPQRLMIPPDRKPHGSRIHGRILGHKYHQVGNKGCLWIDGTEPVGDTTENGIETGGGDTAHIDPCMSHVARQLRTIGQITVPYSGMMGTVVAQSVDCFHPTFQTLILRYTEAAGNALLCGHVSKVHKKFCQYLLPSLAGKGRGWVCSPGIPLLGIKDSHTGNIAFPYWE